MIYQCFDVCAADDAVDDLHRDTYGTIKTEIQKDPERTETLIHYLSVSRYLERIADHATNIAEDVIYLVDGDIVRHGGGKQAPKLGPKKPNR